MNELAQYFVSICLVFDLDADLANNMANDQAQVTPDDMDYYPVFMNPNSGLCMWSDPRATMLKRAHYLSFAKSNTQSFKVKTFFYRANALANLMSTVASWSIPDLHFLQGYTFIMDDHGATFDLGGPTNELYTYFFSDKCVFSPDVFLFEEDPVEAEAQVAPITASNGTFMKMYYTLGRMIPLLMRREVCLSAFLSDLFIFMLCKWGNSVGMENKLTLEELRSFSPKELLPYRASRELL